MIENKFYHHYLIFIISILISINIIIDFNNKSVCFASIININNENKLQSNDKYLTSTSMLTTTTATTVTIKTNTSTTTTTTTTTTTSTTSSIINKSIILNNYQSNELNVNESEIKIWDKFDENYNNKNNESLISSTTTTSSSIINNTNNFTTTTTEKTTTNSNKPFEKINNNSIDNSNNNENKTYEFNFSRLTVVDHVIILIGGSLSMITILGNVLVMVAFKIDRQLQTISNYFLLSLAVADFLIGFISMPLSLIYIVAKVWPLGYTVCDIWLAIDYLNSNASVLNLLLISFDRYFSVTRPLTYRAKRTTRRACTFIAFAWIVSALLWPPWIFAWPKIEGRRTVPEYQCYIPFLESNIWVTTITAIMAFWLPVTIMCILYWRIWRETENRYRELTSLVVISPATSNQPTATISATTTTTIAKLSTPTASSAFTSDVGPEADNGLSTNNGSHKTIKLKSSKNYVEDDEKNIHAHKKNSNQKQSTRTHKIPSHLPNCPHNLIEQSSKIHISPITLSNVSEISQHQEINSKNLEPKEIKTTCTDSGEKIPRSSRTDNNNKPPLISIINRAMSHPSIEQESYKKESLPKIFSTHDYEDEIKLENIQRSTIEELVCLKSPASIIGQNLNVEDYENELFKIAAENNLKTTESRRKTFKFFTWLRNLFKFNHKIDNNNVINKNDQNKKYSLQELQSESNLSNINNTKTTTTLTSTKKNQCPACEYKLRKKFLRQKRLQKIKQLKKQKSLEYEKSNIIDNNNRMIMMDKSKNHLINIKKSNINYHIKEIETFNNNNNNNDDDDNNNNTIYTIVIKLQDSNVIEQYNNHYYDKSIKMLRSSSSSSITKQDNQNDDDDDDGEDDDDDVDENYFINVDDDNIDIDDDDDDNYDENDDDFDINDYDVNINDEIINLNDELENIFKQNAKNKKQGDEDESDLSIQIKNCCPFRCIGKGNKNIGNKTIDDDNDDANDDNENDNKNNKKLSNRSITITPVIISKHSKINNQQQQQQQSDSQLLQIQKSTTSTTTATTKTTTTATTSTSATATVSTPAFTRVRATFQPKSERKAAKTLSAILLAFIVTWTPYNVLVLLKTFYTGLVDPEGVWWQFAYFLCYVNSTLNPLLYALCNANFRRTYIRILTCKFRRVNQPSSTIGSAVAAIHQARRLQQRQTQHFGQPQQQQQESDQQQQKPQKRHHHHHHHHNRNNQNHNNNNNNNHNQKLQNYRFKHGQQPDNDDDNQKNQQQCDLKQRKIDNDKNDTIIMKQQQQQQNATSSKILMTTTNDVENHENKKEILSKNIIATKANIHDDES